MNAMVPHADFSSFVSAVVANARGDVFDNRLVRESVALGIQEGIGSAGGFLVPDTLAQTIWERASSVGLLFPKTSRLLQSREGKIEIPSVDEANRANGSRFGGLRLYWVDEAAAPTKSRPKFSKIGLELKKLLGLIGITDEVLNDSALLAGFLSRAMGQEAAFVLDDAIVNGSGSGTPLGVLNSAALIQVEKESGQSSSTVQYINLVKMAARLWGPSHKNAMWLMSNETFEAVAPITTPQNIPVVTYENGRKFILGIPVELCEYTPTFGSAGDIVLLDPSQYILAGSTDAETISSIHVSFDTNESVFRFRLRVDGQPGWSSPVVPANSTKSQSPFVALIPAS